MGKVPTTEDDYCMITHTHYSDLDCSVQTPEDNRIYDAVSLQNWLKGNDKLFVIPGINIENILYVPKWTNWLSRTRQIYIRPPEKIVESEKNEVGTQTEWGPTILLREYMPVPVTTPFIPKESRGFLPRRMQQQMS